MKTKIFLDGSDPDETKKIIDELGFLDGQTTNPTLVSKNPEIAKSIAKGEKFSQEGILEMYKDIVAKISFLIPRGSVSIEVYADSKTTAEQMLEQAKEMNTWILNAHIKYPTTLEGLKAAKESIKLGIKVNMTLVFSQEQAGAVYAATRGAKKGDVFVSPFIGRLDDRGENGMDLIKNILKMYEGGDGHVEVLTASVRNIDHFACSLEIGSDIITAPCLLLEEWIKSGVKIPLSNSYIYDSKNLIQIPYINLDLNKDFKKFNIYNDLTEKGIEKFSSDWNNLIS